MRRNATGTPSSWPAALGGGEVDALMRSIVAASELTQARTTETPRRLRYDR